MINSDWWNKRPRPIIIQKNPAVQPKSVQCNPVLDVPVINAHMTRLFGVEQPEWLLWQPVHNAHKSEVQLSLLCMQKKKKKKKGKKKKGKEKRDLQSQLKQFNLQHCLSGKKKRGKEKKWANEF